MLTRRRFLQLAGAGAAVAALPWQAACGDNALQGPTGRFFTAHQWATIDVATGLLLPGLGTDDGTGNPSALPGARDAVVVAYIDQLCAAFSVDPPMIFAGGPASGRQPDPDPTTGKPTTTRARDAFATYLPLSRVRAIAWHMRIDGSAATPGGSFNDAVLGPTVGYRDLYASGVVALDAAAAEREPGSTFIELAADDQQKALDLVQVNQPAFYAQLLAHTLEGMFAAPEYGGNQKLVGWQLGQYDGDSVPLGHSFYDAATDTMIDRTDQPTATPTPGATAEDFSTAVLGLIGLAAAGSGGQRFF